MTIGTNEGSRLRDREDARDASNVEEPIDMGELATDTNFGLGCADTGAMSSEATGAIDREGVLEAGWTVFGSLVDTTGGSAGMATAAGGLLVGAGTAMPNDASCDAS